MEREENNKIENLKEYIWLIGVILVVSVLIYFAYNSEFVRELVNNSVKEVQQKKDNSDIELEKIKKEFPFFGDDIRSDLNKNEISDLRLMIEKMKMARELAENALIEESSKEEPNMALAFQKANNIMNSFKKEMERFIDPNKREKFESDFIS